MKASKEEHTTRKEKRIIPVNSKIGNEYIG
mgnify:CR=1 FL=1